MTAVAFTLPRPDLVAPGRVEVRQATEATLPSKNNFHQTYEANSPALLRYLTRATSDRDLAQDLLQDVFFRYVKSSFQGESDEHRRRFLFRVASNLVIDHYRRQRPFQLSLEKAAGIATSPPSSLRYDLAPLLAKLSIRDRQLVWLAHVEGFSHQEIADMLKLRTASVRPALFRARKRLAKILSAHGIGPEVLRS